ncbi:trehalose 6-phosphate synthase /trehalose 6-phosphatase [Arcticibacter tournemirensis]|uniref:Alpha,alpha-trehalose-phosphate synthase n=1 Tax=Arcticibacter tournemirensis TaxID=699437 RepID=A0A5M9HMI7_9SPHI|nr:bifunctional alpha,alpha-trehalose-phosphate synthase (UDP-forming)/trehalose-phosphatase [Arcticibacter tournemirensis]KAA8486681.1 bifunctional alpha,alpha-trehalose-phosphate synthase (UDP-forming)/trehalose-phosphatase [Arcticibacter tournemirensis]TQM49218.1 trehalose 6-phosphate synthase /trehalose 6-phosphatase [Arcticibacter tournemirensis]
MKTIIVSNRLPVKITNNNGEMEFRQSEGGLATGLGSIYRQGNNMWLGWPGIEAADEENHDEITARLEKMNLYPVFLTQEEISLYYEGFSNETLWPIFHYHPTYARYEQSYWDSYVEVNKKFKEAIFKIAEPGDTIWIHDYQLLLLPGMIRQEQPNITIGFFLHIPFPSYELFRLIPWRAEILDNMLGADLLGFHTFDDVRHFISAVSRILPVHTSANEISYNERVVVAETFPMGIDDKKFESLADSSEVLENAAALRESFGSSKMILSIDRLDYSKGILQRLQAFDILLQKNPEYIEKVFLYMIVVPSRDTVSQYKDLRDEIDKLVGNINARYRTLNWTPVNYYYRSFPVEMLSALYKMAEVCLISPMRDGMNLVSKEYVASRTNNTGVLILSEMAGAAKELIDAVIVNPNNVGEVYRAIIEALNMPLEEQQRRMQAMREVVSKFNIRHWVKIYMDRLQEVKAMQGSMQAKHVEYQTLSLIETQYSRATRRIIFLDYDGTLVGFKSNIDLAFPDEDLYNILQQLIADPANHVVIVSGRKYQTLEDWFGKMPIDMIAEHGVWQKHKDSEWIKMPGLYNQWKQDIRPILETYVDRTPGSFIEEKSYSLVWHYRKVEEGLGELRANDLMNTLRFITVDRGLQMLPGNKVIEIKNVEVNKGKVAATWLDNMNYDYVMALGDDHTDEDMFKVMPETAFTIKIGSNISAARFFLRDYKEVRRLLKSLALKRSVNV